MVVEPMIGAVFRTHEAAFPMPIVDSLHYLDLPTSDAASHLAALFDLKWRKLQRQIRYVWGNEDYFRPQFLAAGISSPDEPWGAT